MGLAMLSGRVVELTLVLDCPPFWTNGSTNTTIIAVHAQFASSIVPLVRAFRMISGTSARRIPTMRIARHPERLRGACMME